MLYENYILLENSSGSRNSEITPKKDFFLAFNSQNWVQNRVRKFA
jgi:hypothetical protein